MNEQSTTPEPPRPRVAPESPMPTKPKAQKVNWTVIIIVVLLAVVILLAFVYWQGDQNQEESEVYNAVFLDNNQVYFGKVTQETNDYLYLTDVHYLKNEAPAEGEEEGAPSPGFSVIPLGNEVHGPENAIMINQAHILYIETLRDDSEVVDAITKE